MKDAHPLFRQARFSSLLLAGLVSFLLIPPAVPEGLTTICDIQGSGPVSPMVGQLVAVRGVVTLDWDTTGAEGFFMQNDACDTDPATSEGLFIYLGERAEIVSAGDFVEARGWVTEYQGLTEVSAGPEYITFLGRLPQPPPVDFSPPWSAAASRAYFEAHEGMRVRISSGNVVGPTTSRDETYVVPSALGVVRVMEGDPYGAVTKIADRGGFEIAPEVRVGDRVLNLVGVLDVGSQEFQMQLTAAPVVVPLRPEALQRRETSGELSFATVNLHNLFDTFDDPATQDSVLSASQYQTRLGKLAQVIAFGLGEPLFLAVQEAENGAVLQALANRPEFSVQYGFEHFDGPDVRGIDVALLYRMDRVVILGSESRQGCTALVDGLGPDGNLDPVNPQNGLTCDLDGQPGLDGNRLFSRPPLVVQLAVCDVLCDEGAGRAIYWAVVVHLKSKSQDTAAVAYTLPRRLAQAAFLAGLVEEIETTRFGSRVIVLGDFNDYPSSAPVGVIRAAGMVNLMDGVPASGAYTYNFKGISQVLDHVFVSRTLAADPLRILAARPLPVGSDFPADLEYDASTMLRASDHDPVLVQMFHLDRVFYFPFFGVKQP